MKKKKQLLFINGHLNVGGVEKSLIDLLNHIDYNLYDIDLLLLEGKGDYYHQLAPQVNVIYKNITEAYGPIFPTIWKNLEQRKYTNIIFRLIIIFSSYFGNNILLFLRPILNKKKYDYAIAYRPGICTDILVYTIQSKRKIAWWHHGECNYNPNTIKKTNKVWRHLDNLITVSRGCKKILEETFVFPPNKLHVIPNLIDIVKINNLAGELTPYENNNKLNFITVGRLSPEKHINDVLDITKELIKSNITNFQWHIIGDGELYDEINRNIKRFKLESYIQMHGKKENPYPFIKFANILIHTSPVESQCITVLEAMALKTPCVIRESIGPKEYIKTGFNGFIINDDFTKITPIIKQLIYDVKTSQRIVQEAYLTVSSQYNAPCIIDKFNNICLNKV